MMTVADAGFEFDQQLETFRTLLSEKSSSAILELFMSQDLMYVPVEQLSNQSREEQHALYKTRISALAQALSEHSCAQDFRGSIDVLRRMAGRLFQPAAGTLKA